jgi:hypothetical protein
MLSHALVWLLLTGCSGVRTGRLCDVRANVRWSLGHPNPRGLRSSAVGVRRAFGACPCPSPCVLPPDRIRFIGCECASQDLRTRRTLAPAAADGAAASATVGGVGGVRCAPAESLGSLARWPRARRDACLMRVPWWPHMGGARSASCGAPGDPEVAPGGQRWAGGTPRLRQGWAERPRRTFGPVLGAGARLAWYCSYPKSWRFGRDRISGVRQVSGLSAC